MRIHRWLISSIMPLFFACFASGLEPREVFLLVNKSEPESLKLAEYYCEMRKVPQENIILLEVTKEDDVSRKDYDEKIVLPLRIALRGKQAQAKCLLSIYGMPLRVGAPEPNDEQRVKIAPLELQLQALRKQFAEKTRAADELNKEIADLQGKIAAIFPPPREAEACVDSELMLLWWPKYDLNRFVFNPLNWKFPEDKRRKLPPVLMTSRIDGPTPEIAKRLITDAVETERKGLNGKVYVDARGLKKPAKPDAGWGLEGYDESMREMASLLKDAGKMDVVLDDREELFPAHSCKNCALYCGWYSLSKFIDSSEFVPGAIAWHLASFEALTLKKETTAWCKNLLLKGATVTLGPVAEPYSAAFPKPEEFFGFLATGKYTLVEAYSRTTLFTSWMMVLVGDPLYNPFKNNPRIKEEDVKMSPKWGRYILNEKDE